ncbi:MAG: ATP-binding protein [Bacteroidota bacterium]|nr:ATP-binding protein [Bacteroidota bacterium]
MAKVQTKIFKLVLKSTPKEISKVEPFLKKVNRYIQFEEIQFHNLLVATTEAVNNSITHGNLRDPKKLVEITAAASTTTIEIHVCDEGRGINFKNIPNPLDEKNLLRENGRGIFIIQQFMDSVQFNRSATGSEVIMKLRKRKSKT